jgi:hypothetical protein
MLKPFFKPSQIVCLEHQNNYLYGEVIQIIESRQLCWMRPLMLAVFANDIPTVNSLQEAEELWDVRLTSDVAYPLPLFRPALDLEVLPLMMHLEENVEEGDSLRKQSVHSLRLVLIHRFRILHFLKLHLVSYSIKSNNYLLYLYHKSNNCLLHLVPEPELVMCSTCGSLF